MCIHTVVSNDIYYDTCAICFKRESEVSRRWKYRSNEFLCLFINFFLVPLWSSINISGVLLRDILPNIGLETDEEGWNEIAKDVIKMYDSSSSSYFASSRMLDTNMSTATLNFRENLELKNNCTYIKYLVLLMIN